MAWPPGADTATAGCSLEPDHTLQLGFASLTIEFGFSLGGFEGPGPVGGGIGWAQCTRAAPLCHESNLGRLRGYCRLRQMRPCSPLGWM